MATPIKQADQMRSKSTSEDASTEEKQKSSMADKVQVPPNGGTRAWLQVLGSALIFCNIWGLVFSFGVFQSFYMANFLREYSPSQISWIGTTEFFCLVSVGIVTGLLFDLGYRNVQIYVSSAMIVFGIMMLSLSTKYYQIMLSQGICLGIGSGILLVPTLTLATASFTTRRAFAVMLVTLGSNIGGIIYPIVFRRLLPNLGFAMTVRIVGFIILGTTIIAIPLLITGQERRPKKLRSLIDRTAFSDPPYLIYNFGGFLRFLGFYIPFVYLPIYAQMRLQVATSNAFDLIAYTNAGSFVGRLFTGWIAFKFGVMAPWTICAFASGIACLAWLKVTSFAGMVAFCVVFGFFSGALISLPPAVLPYICPIDVFGTRLGMTWGIAGLAILIGSPVAGQLVDVKNADFVGLQLLSGIALLSGACCQLPLWWMIRKKIAAVDTATAAAAAARPRNTT